MAEHQDRERSTLRRLNDVNELLEQENAALRKNIQLLADNSGVQTANVFGAVLTLIDDKLQRYAIGNEPTDKRAPQSIKRNTEGVKDSQGPGFSTITCHDERNAGRPDSSKYGPVSSSHGPESHNYGLKSPSYGPKSPSYGPVSPNYGPKSPNYGPVSPSYGPVTPRHGPESKSYGPESPSYGPVSPGYGPVTPSHRPISHIYEPESPSYGPSFQQVNYTDIASLSKPYSKHDASRIHPKSINFTPTPPFSSQPGGSNRHSPSFGQPFKNMSYRDIASIVRPNHINFNSQTIDYNDPEIGSQHRSYGKEFEKVGLSELDGPSNETERNRTPRELAEKHSPSYGREFEKVGLSELNGPSNETERNRTPRELAEKHSPSYGREFEEIRLNELNDTSFKNDRDKTPIRPVGQDMPLSKECTTYELAGMDQEASREDTGVTSKVFFKTRLSTMIQTAGIVADNRLPNGSSQNKPQRPGLKNTSGANSINQPPMRFGTNPSPFQASIMSVTNHSSKDLKSSHRSKSSHSQASNVISNRKKITEPNTSIHIADQMAEREDGQKKSSSPKELPTTPSPTERSKTVGTFCSFCGSLLNGPCMCARDSVDIPETSTPRQRPNRSGQTFTSDNNDTSTDLNVTRVPLINKYKFNNTRSTVANFTDSLDPGSGRSSLKGNGMIPVDISHHGHSEPETSDASYGRGMVKSQQILDRSNQRASSASESHGIRGGVRSEASYTIANDRNFEKERKDKSFLQTRYLKGLTTERNTQHQPLRPSPDFSAYQQNDTTPQSSTTDNGFRGNYVVTAANAQPEGYDQQIGQPRATSTPKASPRNALNYHGNQVDQNDTVRWAHDQTLNSSQGYTSDALARLMGMDGDDARERAKYVFHRPVDVLTGYVPRLSLDVEMIVNQHISHRLLGEIAFQLDRRILEQVFAVAHGSKQRSRRSRYYGYCVATVADLIVRECRVLENRHPDMEKILFRRLASILEELSRLSFDFKVHSAFTQDIVNKYGLLSNEPNENEALGRCINDVSAMRILIGRLLRNQAELDNMLIIFDCLYFLAYIDQRPLFIW